MIFTERTLLIMSFALDSNKFSSFCVSIGGISISFQMQPTFSNLLAVIGSSRTSFQNNLTVFFVFFGVEVLESAVLLDPKFFKLTPKRGGPKPFIGGGGAAPYLPEPELGGGGGGPCPFIIIMGTGGGHPNPFILL